MTQEQEGPLDRLTPIRANNTFFSLVDGRELKRRPRIPKGKRFDAIKPYIGIYTDEQIAAKYGCSSRTIKQWRHDFFESKEYWDWIEEEWLKLYHSEKIPDYEKFKALSTLLKALLDRMPVEAVKDSVQPVINIVYDKALKDYNGLFKKMSENQADLSNDLGKKDEDEHGSQDGEQGSED